MTRLAHVSDLHFGDAAPALVEALASALEASGADVVVATGDLTQKGKRREFAQAQDFFKRLDAPAVIAPGNHDTPMFNPVARSFGAFRRFNRMAPHDAKRSRSAAAAIRAINTARGVQARLDWSLGRVSLSEAREAASELAGAPAGAARVIACHHPLVTPAGAPFRARTRNGRRAAHLFAEAGVDLVMTGHLHSAFLEPLPAGDHATWALGAGTALSTRTRGEPVGFNTVDIRPEGFEVIRWRLDDDGVFRPGKTETAPRRASPTRPR